MEKATSTPPPILTNRPFEPRSTTLPEDFDDSDFEQHDDPNHILTPSSTQFLNGEDDLPPTYEEAQAEALSQSNTGDRSVTSPTNPNDLEVRRLVLVPNRSPSSPQIAPPTQVRRAATSPTEANRTNAMLNQLLSFTRNAPDADTRYAPHLARKIAVPPSYSTQAAAGFARAYCKALHSHSISPGEFTAFIDGINTILGSAPSTIEAQQSLLYLAEPVGEHAPPASQILQTYFDRANAAFFAPRDLKANLQTLPRLIHRLPLPRDRSERSTVQKLRRSVGKAGDAQAANKALEPYIEMLTWDVPAPALANTNMNVLTASVDHPELRRRPVRSPTAQEPGPATPPMRETGTISNQPGNRDTVATNWSLPSYHTVDPRGVQAQANAQGSAPPQLDIVEETDASQISNPGMVPSRGQSWEDWGTELGRYWERWGQEQGRKWEEYGRRWERRGSDLGRRAENIGAHIERRFTGGSSWDREERERAERDARPQEERPEWEDDDTVVDEERRGCGGGRRRGRGGGPWTRGGGKGGRGRHGHVQSHGHFGHHPPSGPSTYVSPWGAMPAVNHSHPLFGHGGPPNHPLGPGGIFGPPGVGFPSDNPDGPIGEDGPFTDRRGSRGGRRGGGRRDGCHSHHHHRPHGRHREDDPSSSSSSDSDLDSDSESSADEAEGERFDAERDFLRRIESIEKKAREDAMSLGEKAKETDVQKIQQKKAKELSKAQSEKMKAEWRYSVKMYTHDTKRAFKGMKKGLKRGQKEWKRGNRDLGRKEMRRARDGYRKKIKEMREQYKHAVEEYKEATRDWREDRITAQTELKDVRRGGWMVWLVVEDLDARTPL